MLEEKENQNEKTEEKGVLDTPIDLTPEKVEAVKEAIAEEVRKEAGISDEQSALFKQMLDEATMPVKLTDKDFTLGQNELDIRPLSRKNLNQMFFRTYVLQSVALKNIQSSLLDVTRLLLVLLDHLGVEDIVKATDDVLDKVREKNEALKNILNPKEKGN